MLETICEDNLRSIEFFSNTFYVKDLDTKITFLIGKTKGDLYQLPNSFGQQLMIIKFLAIRLFWMVFWCITCLDLLI